MTMTDTGLVLGSRDLFSADILKNVKSNNTNITVHSRFQQQPKNTLLYSVLVAAADRE